MSDRERESYREAIRRTQYRYDSAKHDRRISCLAVMHHEALRAKLEDTEFQGHRYLLHRACCIQDVDSVRYLVEERVQDTSLLIQDSAGRTPLHVVCYNDINSTRTMIASILMRHPTAPEAVLIKDANGCNPLHLAGKGQFSELVSMIATLHSASRALVAQQIDSGYIQTCSVETREIIPLRERPFHKSNALHYACCNADVNMVAPLMKLPTASDALVTARADGDTPLHIAARRASADTIKVLVELNTIGTAMKMKNNAGLTPMDVAHVRGDSEILSILFFYAPGLLK